MSANTISAARRCAQGDMSPMPPLALTDDQLSAVLRAAEPLPPCDRGAFLEDVARELAGRELGDGIVARTCHEVQRRYWRAPDLARGSGAGKYR